MKVGQDLLGVLFFTLVGKFKRENGIHQHMICVADTTILGIETRWWIEKLLEAREQERQSNGSAFGNPENLFVLLCELDGVLHL